MDAGEKAHVQKFADELDEWLRKRFSYRMKMTRPVFRTIDVNRAKVQLYLMMQTSEASEATEEHVWPQHTLVIKKIGFREQHAGHGSALLAFLACQAKAFSYDKIGVECASPEIGIQSFCAKYFFDNPRAERPLWHFIAPVEHIAQRLETADMTGAMSA